MNIKAIVTTVSTVFCSIQIAAAATPQKPADKIEVIEGKSEIVVYQNGKAKSLIVSPRLLNSSRYLIKVGDDGVVGSPSAAQITMQDRIKAQKLLYQANQEFIQGRITKTWELVDAAKKLDPGHYRIKTMEGSLLFQMGSKDLAMNRWRESLKQNPDQPELSALLKGAEKEKQR